MRLGKFFLTWEKEDASHHHHHHLCVGEGGEFSNGCDYSSKQVSSALRMQGRDLWLYYVVVGEAVGRNSSQEVCSKQALP